MARMEFPEWEIHHCENCGCQQWFYPDICPVPDVILCALCRGTVFSHSFDEEQPEVFESVTRTCDGCGVDISHLRAQARTCSAKCRKAVSRKAG